jgi:hypothetical protein
VRRCANLNEGDENQDRGDREEDDQNDSGGSHFGSLHLVERGYFGDMGWRSGDLAVADADECRSAEAE